jgi:hypothetical protein
MLFNPSPTMQSRFRLSLIISLAVFGVAIVGSLLKAPDTSNGVPVPGYMWFRFVADGFIAALCFLGCYLGFRLGNAKRLSLLTGLVIALLYAVGLYLPSFPVTVTLDQSGNIQSSSGAWWWSLYAPFVLPFLLALIVPRLPLSK